MMTGFIQGWMRSEQARHQALLHQLKRELAAARSTTPKEELIRIAPVAPAELSEPADQPAAEVPASPSPVLRSTTPRPVKHRTEGNRDLLRGVAIR